MTKRWFLTVLSLLLLPAAALAEPVRALWNGTGTGGVHVPGAEIRAGQGAATLHGGYTNQGGLLAPGDEVTRTRYGLGGLYAPLPYLELGLSASGSNVDVEPNGLELDSFGDFALAAKGAYPVHENFSTGLRAQLRLYSGVGGPDGTESGYGDTASYAGEWVSTARLGNFAVHAALGFLYDRTVNFTRGIPTNAERFAWGQTDFNQVTYGLAINLETEFADYLVEVSGEKPVGDGAPAFSESPLRVTPGLRLRPWGPAELHLGADFSLTDAGGLGVPAQPDYELLAALRWHFGAAEPTAEKIEETEPVIPAPAPTSAPPVEEPAVEEPAAAPSPGMRTGAVSGTVTNAQTGAPIAGARVRIEGAGIEATSNAQGNFLFSAVAEGMARVTVEAEEMEPLTIEVAVPADAATTVDAKLVPRSVDGKLLLRALDAGGKPLADVEVRVNGELRGRTNAAGELEISGVAPGMQEISFRKYGYQAPESVFLEVSAGQTTPETVTLVAEPRPGFVEVKAVDADRQPMAATLTVEGHPEWTRQLDPAAGSTTTLKVPPGTYRFRVEAPGYVPEVQEVEVEEDDEEALRFKLQRL